MIIDHLSMKPEKPKMLCEENDLALVGTCENMRDNKVVIEVQECRESNSRQVQWQGPFSFILR